MDERKELRLMGAVYVAGYGWYLGDDAHFGPGGDARFLGRNAKDAKKYLDEQEYIDSYREEASW